MTQRLTLNANPVWLKHYGNEQRRLVLGALDLCVRSLGVKPLRPPPRHPGEHGKRLEMRRLDELRRAHVRVPEVIGEGPAILLLADLGDSLSATLKRHASDAAAVDSLVAGAVDAIAGVHARGHYLGQPIPRNLVINGQGVGFIDFEEDPCEVMSLRDAQVRDWLLFAHGTSRYFRGRPERLAAHLAQGITRADLQIGERVRDAGMRLRPIERLARAFGRSTGNLVTALTAIRSTAAAVLLVAIAFTIDFLHDGDIDLLAWNLMPGILT